MSRLTLRLPETLHRQLKTLAENEEVSLNQYIVYALTKQVTLEYTIQTVPEKAIADQKAAYAALLQNLGQASFEEIQQLLEDREDVPAEDGLTPELLQSLQSKINSQQR